MKKTLLSSVAILLGLGAIGSAADAATTMNVDITATPGGTPITLGGAASPQFSFVLGTFFTGANEYILQANGTAKVAFPDNGVFQAPRDFVVTGVDATAFSTGFSNLGDFQLFFNVGSTAYTGLATVVDAGHRISAISFSPVAAAVPEPAMWAMMVLGFGLIGGAARYRRPTAALRYS